MNIVIRHDTGVDVYKSWKEVKKYTSFTKEDFAQIGTDYCLDIDNESYEISKDIKTLERVASERVFAKKDMSGIDWLTVATFALVVYQIL